MKPFFIALLAFALLQAAFGGEWQCSCFRGRAMVRQAEGAVELVYDFGDNDGSYAVCQSAVPAGAGGKALEVSIKNPSDNGINLRVWDQSGECFQKPVNAPCCEDWQKISVALEGYPEHWGGDGNGVFDGEPSQIGFAVTLGMSACSRGVFAFRDPGFAEGRPAAPRRHIRVDPAVRLKGDRTVFTVSLSGDPGPCVLYAEFRDSRGRLAGLEARRAAVPEGESVTETFERPFGDMLQGTFYTDASPYVFASAAEPGPSEERRSVWAVRAPREPAGLSEGSGAALGMGVYLYRRRDPSEDFAELRETAALAASAGVRWIREEFGGPSIEPEKGKPDFAFYDRLVAEARAAGLNIYGLMCYYPRWTVPGTPEANLEFSRFAGELAERYKEDIRYWEIWNEPNGGFYPWGEEQYFALHRLCYDAIKKADPSLQVIGCSSAAGDPDFIARAVKAGCRFDIASSHPYRTALVDPLLIRQLQETVKASGGKKVWLTEMGWPTHTRGGQSRQRQAEFLVRAYMDALSVPGVENLTWYDFIDDGADPAEMEHSFGLLTVDRQPKPSFLAFRTLARAVGDKQYAASPYAGEGIAARLWKTPPGAAEPSQTLCLWPQEKGFYLIRCRGDFAAEDLYGKPLPPLVYLRAAEPVFVTGEDLTGLEVLRQDARFAYTLKAGCKTVPVLPQKLPLRAVLLPDGVRFQDGVITADKGIKAPCKAYFEAGGFPLTVDVVPETLFVP